jgi:hypothetical protein
VRGAEAGRAGHVYADETSWQAFEDVAGKDGHRCGCGVFITDATTVFVMDTSRSAEVTTAQLSTGREQAALEAGRRLVISSDLHKAYQSLACQGHLPFLPGHPKDAPAVVPPATSARIPARNLGNPQSRPLALPS